MSLPSNPLAAGLIPPSITPYNPSTTPPALIEARLLALRSSDSNVRIGAFNGLRAVPKPLLREAWERVRWQAPPPGWENDCLHHLHIEKPPHPLEGERAFITVISHGYEPMLRALLTSLELRGNCPGVPFIVFCVGDEVYDALKGWPGVTRIRCHAQGRVSAAVKGALYSCTRYLSYQTIVALEADMLITGDLNYLFEAVQQGHPRNIYGCRSQGVEIIHRLREVLGHMSAPASDLKFLTGKTNLDPLFHFNGGLLAGSWSAWKALDAGIESLNPFVSLWVEGAFHLTFADEFAMNLVLSLSPQSLAAVELAPGWNTQIIDKNVSHWVQENPTPTGSQFTRQGEKVRILHFIADKTLQAPTLLRLTPSPPVAPMRQLAPDVEPTSPYILCRQCRIKKTCACHFEPSSFARNPLKSGMRSALCKVCFRRQQGQSEQQIDAELLETAFELKEEQRLVAQA